MTTNDTRTAQERAEQLAVELFPSLRSPGNMMRRASFVEGFTRRDAEPTTVTAEQIEAAERRGAVKALRDFADGVRFPNHWVLFRRVEDDSPVSVGDLLRETARNIEGDPA